MLSTLASPRGPPSIRHVEILPPANLNDITFLKLIPRKELNAEFYKATPEEADAGLHPISHSEDTDVAVGWWLTFQGDAPQRIT